jgi:hypothetical protein
VLYLLQKEEGNIDTLKTEYKSRQGKRTTQPQVLLQLNGIEGRVKTGRTDGIMRPDELTHPSFAQGTFKFPKPNTESE